MTNAKRITFVVLAIVLLLGGSLFISYKMLFPKPISGEKSITVTVTHSDGEENEFIFYTDEEYLRGVLEGNRLVKGSESEYGLFITEVDGEIADGSDNRWWTYTRFGEYVETGVDTTVIYDGDEFEFSIYAG